MRQYLLGWGQPCVDRKMASGELTIDHLATNQLYRAGIQAGDTIWIVCSPESSRLHLVGRLVVGTVVGREGAVRRLDASCVATHDIFALPAPGFVDRVDPIDITDQAATLRFHARTERLPERFDSRHLAALRRLHLSAGDQLWQVWDRARRAKRASKHSA